MKKFFLFPITALAIILGSCNNQLDEEIQKLSSQQVITAKISDNQSRTTTNGVKVLWSEGDQIGVIRTASEINTNQYFDNPFTLSSGQGTQSATFAASLSQGRANVAAYYPYRENTSYNGKITVNIPAEQLYDDGNQMLMVGQFENGSSSVAFKNAMALAVITVKNISTDYSKAVLTASNNEYLAGTATVTLGDNVSMQIDANSQPSNKLTINFGENTTTEKRFYFAIPAGTYANGLTMTLEGDNCEPLTVGTLKDDNNSEQFTPEINEFVDHTVTLDDEVSAVQMVGTPEQLEEALADGGFVKLSQEIELNENLNISDDASIDLNGQNLNMGSNTIEVAEGKSLTLTNSGTPSGRAAETTVGITSSSDIITASKDSKIFIGEGVNLTTTGAGMCCIFVPGSDANNIANDVTIESRGTLLAKQAGAATIYVNGNVTSGTINILGGSVKHEADVAIYIAGQANLTISGDAEISGTTGVEVRAGNLTVENATITATGDPLTATPNGNGTTTVGAAIAISQHTTNHAITAIIKNGTFTGVNALYEADLQAEDKVATEVTLNVTGGTFNGEVYSASYSGFISGGTFTKASAFDYLADYADVILGANMNITTPIVISQTGVKLSLNEKNIISTVDAIEVNGGSLTINGEGNVKAGIGGEKGSYCALFAHDNATVNIEGGSYYVDGQDWNDCIYAKNGTTINIKGGTFESINTKDNGNGLQHWVLNCRGVETGIAKSTIVVTGGTFINYNPANNVSEGSETNYVADGYKVLVNGQETTAMHNATNETRTEYIVSNQ